MSQADEQSYELPPPTIRDRIFSFVLFGACCYALYFLFLKILGCYDVPPPRPENNFFYGTSWAPFSDALGPWLHGGINYYFLNAPMDYLYRPTVGVFYAAILSAFEQVQLIPYFFEAWLVVLFAGLFFWTPVSMRAAMCAWAFLAWIGFDQQLKPLAPGSQMIDFPSFVFTFAGLILVARTMQREIPGMWQFLCGMLFLGIAATIRGPLLLGGPIILLTCFAKLFRTSRMEIFLMGAAALATPLLVDLAIQKQFGTMNNGVNNVYCFYSEPTHSWTPACFDRYKAGHFDDRDVLTNYYDYVKSPEGSTVVADFVKGRLKADLPSLLNRNVLIAAGLLALMALLRFPWRTRWGGTEGGLVLRIALAAGFLAWFNANKDNPDLWIPVAVVFLISMAIFSLLFELYATRVMILSYICGLTFLSLLGLVYFERIAATFTFGLMMALFLFVSERGDEASTSGENIWSGEFFAFLNTCVIVFLYLGNFVIHNPTKALYRDHVAGKAAAIKISEDPRIDRALYVTVEKMKPSYFHADGLPFGTVRIFDDGKTPIIWGNNSFDAPIPFEGTHVETFK